MSPRRPMVTLYRRTDQYDRRELRIGLTEIAVVRLRPAVGGGWYVREHTGIPWPWVRRDV